MKQLLMQLSLGLIALLFQSALQAACPNCCDGMGGIHYCDSSSGRYVCKNGAESACYCNRHAVMDLQKFQGCCLWQGGVLKYDPRGLVLCKNGSFSEICSLSRSANPNSW